LCALEDLDPAPIQKALDESRLRVITGVHRAWLRLFRSGALRDARREVAVLQAHRAYLARRTEPPRCLACGSTDAYPLPDLSPFGPAWRHPGCGGSLLRYESPVRFACVYPLRTYDEEGRNICVDVE
jgi:hypothetical protein